MRSKVFFGLVLLLVTSNATVAQTTVFTYQGKLADNGNPAPNGNYDFQFSLFDALSGGAQQGTTQTATNILVTNGIFAVTLDFVNCSGCACPTCFNGGARFLAIAVKPTGGGSFTPLTPRQPITSTPYAVKSATSGAADGLSVACVSCVTSSQIATVNGSAVTGAIPVGSVPAGSTNYIQNSTSPQTPPGNFNISGNGTADTFSAVTQFNIGGDRILSNGGSGNLFGGVGAGAANTGTQNSFFGFNAGNVNVNGSSNAFFGNNVGSRNKGGSNNSFFGRSAGEFNEFESGNTFIGSFAGFDNGDGDTSMTANFNTFIGHDAGISNSKGASNVFVGKDAGATNVTGNGNTAIGASATFAFNNLVNATAIGSLAQVMQSNSLVLGSINGVNNATADTNVGIGTTAPAHKLHVSQPVAGTSALVAENTFSGDVEGTGVEGRSVNNPGFGVGGRFTGGRLGVLANANAATNSTTPRIGVFGNASGANGLNYGVFGSADVTSGSIFGIGVYGQAIGPSIINYGVYALASGGTTNWAGYFDGNTYVGGNLGIGTTAPTFKLTVSDFLNTGLRVTTATAGGTVASFGGNGAFEVDSPGSAGGRFRVAEDGLVTVGRSGVGGDLTVFGNTLLNTVTIANGATLNVLGAAGSTFLCRNASAQISTCSSSLRYKQNIHPFGSGLSLINRLRPVTFNWKANNDPDLGLVAEEVAKVEPLLTFRNDKGEIEGVKYDRIAVVLLNAVKEQQAQIAAQQSQIENQQRVIETQKQLFARKAEQIQRQQQQLSRRQQQQIDALKNLVCSSRRKAKACQ